MTTAPRPHVDYATRPMLVFWETTRACLLACQHCRASAAPDPLPGQLDTAEGLHLIDQVAGFGRPYPILVLTGGDCLSRPDLFELVAHARERGVPVALSPSVTPRLTPSTIERIAASGVSTVSISLDGATAAVHDGVRGVPGHFDATLDAMRRVVVAGLTLQVNTTVMRPTVDELADVAGLVADVGAHIWEVFFLVPVGRGQRSEAISRLEHADVCHFLYDAASRGFIVRTVEAPFFRRIVAERAAGGPPPQRPLYRRLLSRLDEVTGAPRRHVRAHTTATRDGKGIVFVAHDGQVYPAGFLPLPLGDVRSTPLSEIYRGTPLLRDIRAARFNGPCGTCAYRDLCGGSRARAFTMTGDPLGTDPACPYLDAAAVRETPPGVEGALPAGR